jgi:hypothetical protein
MEICMEDNRLPPPLPDREGSTIELVRAQQNARSLFKRYEFLAVCLFVLVSIYLIWKVARELGKVAALDAQHDRSISEIDARLKDQARRLDQTEHELLQALGEARERNARMERRLAQIEHDHRALEKANTRMLQDEHKLGARLDQLYTWVTVPTAPTGRLTLPPGTVAIPDDKNGEVWVVFREGKEHRVRPLAGWSGGTLVRDLTDGKPYFLTADGQLRDLK